MYASTRASAPLDTSHLAKSIRSAIKLAEETVGTNVIAVTALASVCVHLSRATGDDIQRIEEKASLHLQPTFEGSLMFRILIPCSCKPAERLRFAQCVARLIGRDGYEVYVDDRVA